MANRDIASARNIHGAVNGHRIARISSESNPIPGTAAHRLRPSTVCSDVDIACISRYCGIGTGLDGGVGLARSHLPNGSSGICRLGVRVVGRLAVGVITRLGIRIRGIQRLRICVIRRLRVGVAGVRSAFEGNQLHSVAVRRGLRGSGTVGAERGYDPVLCEVAVAGADERITTARTRHGSVHRSGKEEVVGKGRTHRTRSLRNTRASAASGLIYRSGRGKASIFLSKYFRVASGTG